MPPSVLFLDHLVLTVLDIPTTIQFYETVLGMHAIEFNPADGSTRWALSFGAQKINLHPVGGEFDPKSNQPTPGSADLCFLSDQPLSEWQGHLATHGVQIEEGPVPRTGATGPILSLYVRDPDHNLIEISNRA
ncbi:VOC family protein [uncultured Pelagimonas sp.]|uniref:VOC family protein n=1 Tax=uncultured Pelagimonas sp. TaxID=1618102 RepID=UPI00260B1AF5|nr:VOC family protein [uncultured Pelagimonas sp.]